MTVFSKIKEKIRCGDKTIFLMFILSGFASVINYVFQLVLSKMLSISDFGSYNTLNSLASNLGSLYTPLSVYACRIAAENQKNLNNARCLYKKLFSFSLCISGIILGVGLLVLSSNHIEYMQMSRAIYTILIIGMVVIGGFYSIFNGILQGINRFGWYGLFAVGLMITRLVLVYIGLNVDGSLVTVISSIVVSYVIMIALIVVIVLDTVRHRSIKTKKYIIPDVTYREIIQMYGTTFFVQIFWSLYINGGDIILLNYMYGNEAVGVYSLAATIAKISVYILSIFTSVLLPVVRAEWIQGKSIRKKLYYSLTCSMAIGIAWIVFLITIGSHIIPEIMGEKYGMALSNIKYMAIWIIGIGMLMVINTFYLAINQLKFYLFILVSITILLVMYVSAVNVSLWYVPLVCGAGVSVIVVFSIFDIIQKERKCKIRM